MVIFDVTGVIFLDRGRKTEDRVLGESHQWISDQSSVFCHCEEPGYPGDAAIQLQ